MLGAIRADGGGPLPFPRVSERKAGGCWGGRIRLKSALTDDFSPLVWRGDSLRLLDQRRLPADEVWVETSDYRDVIARIRDMSVRGAPAIGIAGAYALALAAIELVGDCGGGGFSDRLHAAAGEIKTARPTGANLAWAVERALGAAARAQTAEEVASELAAEAERIHGEDVQSNRRIGANGAKLIPWGSSALTHCNTGALATGGYGTALGIIRAAWEQNRLERVYATETRPMLQGARLTAWELRREGMESRLVADSAAGALMRSGIVNAVIVGADRIAANGDVANKIGTYSLAALARDNGIPFYVAAPSGTFDMTLSSGDEIVIEERAADEVLSYGGDRVAPSGMDAFNPAFDVTPNGYVTAIITERGVARAPYRRSLADMMTAAATGANAEDDDNG